MTDQLLAEKPEVEETWMRGALLNRLGAVRFALLPFDLLISPRLTLSLLLQPEDFVGPAVFLLSDASAFMTGADLRVDGGHCASA